MRILNLNGKWVVSSDAKPTRFAGRVPGTVHLDLLRTGHISDPYFRDEEARVQWVGERAWQYQRTFDVPSAWLSAPQAILRFAGLDTLASVALNGKRILRADNMHRTWELEVRRHLRAGKNTLVVRFEPVLPYLKRKERIKPRTYGWTSARLHDAGWLRKEPCNFGWDWGPKLLTAGIWRDVELVFVDRARILDVAVAQSHATRRVDCSVVVHVENPRRLTLRVQGELALRGKTVGEARGNVKAGRAKLEFRLERPELWWPNGLGEQPLYDLRVELLDADGNSIQTTRRRIGLRTLALRTRGDRFGQSFEFVVNGVPFFAKGANWIPADAFAPRVGAEDYARLLGDAANANMNMLRVWGGGIYEEDGFYDRCDELGLCVWQDFMFACGTYPAYDDEFMQNVKREAEDNVKRLRHHACMALFCGNNEIEQGLVSDRWTPTTMSWRDYDRLFGKLLRTVVERLAPHVSYWPGSPHTPKGDRRDWNNADAGDAHLWGVWHGKKPFEWYRECQHRFVSEFGFQSFPHPRTVRAYTVATDRNITSRVMEHHQRSPIGNTTIISHMTEWFLFPKDFESTLWLSQIQQGMAMKYACEHWRRNVPRSMGALYWQLNDCWPVASWSSIDSFGRYKALHYMARHFFAPLLVSGVEDKASGTVAVFVCNDRRVPVRGRVEWRATDAAGNELTGGSLTARVAAGKSVRVGKLELAEFLSKCGKNDFLVWLDLRVGKQLVSENLVSFTRPKHLELEDPEIRSSVQSRGEWFDVMLEARRVALWCWLDLARTDAEFSDNFVHLCQGQVKKLRVRPKRKLDRAAFEKQLRIRHLGSTHEP